MYKKNQTKHTVGRNKKKKKRNVNKSLRLAIKYWILGLEYWVWHVLIFLYFDWYEVSQALQIKYVLPTYRCTIKLVSIIINLFLRHQCVVYPLLSQKNSQLCSFHSQSRTEDRVPHSGTSRLGLFDGLILWS